MILKELQIDRSPSYGDRPNQLQGSVTLGDGVSEHKIALSALDINRMIACIAETVSIRAKTQVDGIPESLALAQEENKLLLNNGEIQMPF